MVMHVLGPRCFGVEGDKPSQGPKTRWHGGRILLAGGETQRPAGRPGGEDPCCPLFGSLLGWRQEITQASYG